MPDFMHFHMCKMFTAFLVLRPVSELNMHVEDSSECPWKRPSHRPCSQGRRLEDRHLLTGMHARPFRGRRTARLPSGSPCTPCPPRARRTPGPSCSPRPTRRPWHAPISASPSTPNLQGNPATDPPRVAARPPQLTRALDSPVLSPPHRCQIQCGPAVSVSVIYSGREKAAGTGPCRMTGQAAM